MNYAVILAGGLGTRFWPLSRKHLPKQFLRIIEKQSLIEATIRRVKKVVSEENIFIVTNNLYLEEIKKQLTNFCIPRANIILEPEPKDTLPAISLCAQIIIQKDPEANLLILPSDHYIKDNIGFRQNIVKALELSFEGFLCLIGIKPHKPRSGYGYIEVEQKKNKKDAFYVKRFKEKPNLSEAKKFFGKKNIFWNSGIFCFKAQVFLNELNKYTPVLYRQIKKIKSRQNLTEIWSKIKPISIDYGILEKSNNLLMLTARFRWCDLGSWDALGDILAKDQKNNIVLSDCDYINLDSRNTFVCSYKHKRLIATVGIRDLIIIDTPDALLVCRREKSQDIKRLVELLKKKRKTCV